MPDYSKKVVKLIDKLIERGEEIKKTCKRLYFSGNKKTIAPEIFEAWKTNCLSLLKSTFGSSSSHYDAFINLKFFDYYNSTQIYLGILKGAKIDLENGYFFYKDLMLSVNIYDSLIKRAQAYLDNGDGFKARVILETTLLEILTKICNNKNINFTRKNTISDLAKKLFRSEVISEDVEIKLKEQQKLLDESPGEPLDSKIFKEVVNWVKTFMNDYLGSQIMIIN